jgi:hypothetical protein
MNMRKTGIFAAALLALGLAACGGGEDAFTGGTSAGGNGKVASLTVITDAPTMPSTGLTPANISVLVKDTNNQFIKGVPVQFSSSSGGLTVVNSVTDDSGIAKATLSTAGDPSNRTITVTASASGQSGQVTVAVTGTTVSIQGPDSLVTNTAGNYEAVVVTSGGSPVAGQSVTLSSQPAATFSATTVTTDANGRAAFTMTATSGTSVVLTAAAVGTTASKSVSVSADSFTFSSPAADTAFGLAPAAATLSTMWSSGGTPISTGTVTFSTTRGTFTTPSTVTPAAGVASVTLNSTTAGEAVVTATNSNGGSTQRRIVFVAANASQIDLQANPFTVGINQSSTITAVVRDVNNNLVAGKNVVFSLSDPTGGSLSVGTAVTDPQGRASTVYHASSTTSASNGVRVSATVQGTAVTDAVDLTVAGSPLFLSFGTGNQIGESQDGTQYTVNYTVQVMDSTAAGVPGVAVSLSALSWNYMKGFRVAGTSAWTTQVTANCINEDRITGNPQYDFNGILDPGENQNGNNNSGVPSMESGGIVTIVMTGSNVTDATGRVQFSIVYPQEYAYYLTLVLRARTAVQGTEFTRETLPFLLSGVSTDFNNITIAPPGMTSPFGTANTCTTFN